MFEPESFESSETQLQSEVPAQQIAQNSLKVLNQNSKEIVQDENPVVPLDVIEDSSEASKEEETRYNLSKSSSPKGVIHKIARMESLIIDKQTLPIPGSKYLTDWETPEITTTTDEYEAVELDIIPEPNCENKESESKEDSIPVKKKSFIERFLQQVAFLVLIVAMLAVASGGVAFKKLPEDIQAKPLLVSHWRMQTMLFFFIPLAGWQLYRTTPEERAHLKNWRLWGLIFLAGISVTMWSGTWAVALNFTTIIRAYLLNNCQPLIMVIWNKISRKPVSVMHIVGVTIGIAGLVLTSASQLIHDSNFTPREFIGDGIAFLGAIFACMYLSLGSNIRAKIPSAVYLTPVTLVSFIIFGIASLSVEHTSFSDLFKWTETQNLPVIAWFAMVSGLLGISLISVVLKYLPTLIVSVVLLFEPIAASIMGIIIGVEPVHNEVTWIGSALVMIGIVIVSMGYGDIATRITNFFIRKIRSLAKRQLKVQW